MEDIRDIIKNFNFRGECADYKAMGSGNINSTYLVSCVDGSEINKYVLQRVNTKVFGNIEALMKNIFSVTSYLRNEIKKAGGDENRETLHFVKTSDGGNYYKAEDGECYRAYVFVSDSVSYDSVDNAELFKQSGVAFGRFQRYLADFPADTLYETLPDFHNTKLRYDKEFIPAVKNNISGRADKCRKEIDFVVSRESYCSRFVNLIESGDLPLRVTHNDTKLNNVMFDKNSGEAICVIDLDTVMPGLALYDFGDSIRFGANKAAEDERDLSKVGINLDYFKTYAEGFLSQAGESLNKAEKDNLAFSALLMTFECGMRFLTDYLNGDTYFRIEYPEHNLVRAKNQFALVADMEKHMNEMEKIIADIVK